jgi:hypothetical protein
MNNFQDRYIRSDPRRNAKMNPILWDDNTSRYLTFHGKNQEVECFDNINGKGIGIDSESDNIFTQIKCKKGKAEILINNKGIINKKMYDIDLDSIANKSIKGTIDEVDKIHNGNIENTMSFDNMMLNHFSNTMGRLHTNVNKSVLSLHNRSLDNDPFFNPKNI